MINFQGIGVTTVRALRVLWKELMEAADNEAWIERPREALIDGLAETLTEAFTNALM